MGNSIHTTLSSNLNLLYRFIFDFFLISVLTYLKLSGYFRIHTPLVQSYPIGWTRSVIVLRFQSADIHNVLQVITNLLKQSQVNQCKVSCFKDHFFYYNYSEIPIYIVV